jgi:EAL domain-containing protein (putative c-di-GMP-specific phosphodiesterase class I)
VPAAEFLPLAESSGLIVPLGAWLVRDVCRQQHAWREAGLPMVPVSIKLSARQLREEGLVEHIEVALEEYQVPPAMLSFGITESMVMEDLDNALARMNELKAIGVNLAMDHPPRQTAVRLSSGPQSEPADRGRRRGSVAAARMAARPLL